MSSIELQKTSGCKHQPAASADLATLNNDTAISQTEAIFTDPERLDAVDKEVERVSSSPSQEKWNSPKINISRYCVCNLSLLIMGMNDACLGVSLYT